MEPMEAVHLFIESLNPNKQRLPSGLWHFASKPSTLAKHLRASILNLVYTVSATMERWITWLPETN